MNNYGIQPKQIAGGGLKWVLPKRKLGKLSLATPLLIIAGLVMICLGLAFASMPIRAVMDANTPWFSRLFSAIFAVVGLTPAGIGFLLWRIAWLITYGKTQIELTATHLRVKDGLHFKPHKILLPHWRQIDTPSISQFEIVNGGNAGQINLKHLNILVAYHADGTPAGQKNQDLFKDPNTAPLFVAFGYLWLSQKHIKAPH